MNASVTGSALNQIPLVNSTQILTASAQQPMTSVLTPNPVVASTPVVSSTALTGSVPVATGSVPVVTGSVPVVTGTVPVVTGTVPVASTAPLGSTLPVTSVLGASAVQPLPTPLAASGVGTPLVASAVQPLTATSLVGSVPLQQPPLTSTLPVQTAAHFGTTTMSNPVPDDDYRLGRGILDDFRPTSYKTIISTTPSLVGTTTPGLVGTTQVATPSLAVSTPGAIGVSNIKDFL